MTELTSSGRARPCPLCGKPASDKHRPFCSERCALIDLGRWLTGGYAIPTNEVSDDEEAPGTARE